MAFMEQSEPKLTIITINRNNAEGLRKTIESVVNQTFTDFEYIVIDGASTDGSVDVIKEYADKITYWISEPDTGIYNAMNKGIVKATGEYLQFLNSGDWLADKDVIDDFCKSGLNEDIISGNVIMNNTKNEIWESPQKERLVFYVFYKTSIPHQATFIKRQLFNLYGYYNEKNIIVSDWEFFLKCLMINNATYNHFDRLVAHFDMNGMSQNSSFGKLQMEERECILNKYFPAKILSDYDDLSNLKAITKHSLYPYVEIFSQYPKLQWIAKRFLKIILILRGKKYLIPHR
jgi:glycosyltransferase involved in cell wall biosynthesis